MELELSLAPDDATRLPRLALLAPLKTTPARGRAVRILWHDSPDRVLAADGVALVEQRPAWRIERLYPDPDGASWPPGTPSPVLATGRNTAALDYQLPATLMPAAAFEGRARTLNLAHGQGPIAMTVLNGTVRAVAGEHRVGRLRLDGNADAVQAMALALAAEVALTVPVASLGAEALAIVSGTPPKPRHHGPPELPDGLSVAEAFSYTVGHLTDVILHLALTAADGLNEPEPVHQMRVAVRRLRSAIKVFRRATRGPAVDAADQGLRALATHLGPARDWDVFVTETLSGVMAAFPDEKRLTRLQGAAQRRRRGCYEELRAFLAGVEFRCLGIELACLAGGSAWEAALGEAERAGLAMPLHEYAAQVLDKRLKRLLQADPDLAELEPAELHAIRLHAKRLRYAVEIFAPLYPGKASSRYIDRLSRLQDRLGTFNDASVAAGLLAELNGNNGGLSFATGLVLGFVGARGAKVRSRIDRAWHRFRRLQPFWD